MVIMIYKCKRCDHEWATKCLETPNVCPKCKSVYWNKERKLYYDWHRSHKKLVRV